MGRVFPGKTELTCNDMQAHVTNEIKYRESLEAAPRPDGVRLRADRVRLFVWLSVIAFEVSLTGRGRFEHVTGATGARIPSVLGRAWR